MSSGLRCYKRLWQKEATMKRKRRSRKNLRKWITKWAKKTRSVIIPTHTIADNILVDLKAVFWQGFLLTFLGEWGDKSQFSTITMSAAGDAFYVFLGASSVTIILSEGSIRFYIISSRGWWIHFETYFRTKNELSWWNIVPFVRIVNNIWYLLSLRKPSLNLR